MTKFLVLNFHAEHHIFNGLNTRLLGAVNKFSKNNRSIGEDDYRISQAQYSEFISLLENISEKHTSEIISQYDDQIETVGELQNSWAEHSQAKFNQKRLEECLENLSKQANKLSNNNQNSPRKSDYHSHYVKSAETVNGNNEYESSDHLKPTQQNNNPQSSTQKNSKSAVTDFISYFQWCIVERNGDKVKIYWKLMLEQLKDVSGKNVSGNIMRKYFSLFGLNDWVSLRELSQAVMNYINK